MNLVKDITKNTMALKSTVLSTSKAIAGADEVRPSAEAELFMALVDQLALESDLNDGDLLRLLDFLDGTDHAGKNGVRYHLIHKAHQKRMEVYGNRV